MQVKKTYRHPKKESLKKIFQGTGSVLVILRFSVESPDLVCTERFEPLVIASIE